MSERQDSIAKIKLAYENKELGFQKDVGFCRYYDKRSDSHCAVGVLVGKNKKLMDACGDIEEPFEGSYSGDIEGGLQDISVESYWGLLSCELIKLQKLHDRLVGSTYTIKREKKFKNYLYSLN